MSDGDTPDEGAFDLPNDMYSDVLGEMESTPEESETAEEGEGTGDENESQQETQDQETGTPEAESTKTDVDWEARYRELQSYSDKRYNELSEKLAKIEGAQQAQQREETDPFAEDPALKNLSDDQKQMLLRSVDVLLNRRLQDVGVSLDDLPQLKQAVQQQSEEHTRTQIASEFQGLKDKYGDDTVARYIPQMQQLAEQHPNLGPTAIFKMAAFDDLQKGQSERAKALEAERKDRAKSADFGSERPAKPNDGRLTKEQIQKLSHKGLGRPSPRFAALLKETRESMG